MPPMSLKGRLPKRKDVKLSDGEIFPVRGLSLLAITDIISTHTSAMTEIFATFIAKRDEATTADVGPLILEFATKFPTIVAHIIAAGTGDSSAIEEAEGLEFGDQLVLLNEIFSATFKTSDEAKNVLEIVINAIQTSLPVLGLSSPKPISL